jgi:putative endonuclease
MSEWRLYIVRCADGTLYTGVTKDIEARMVAHNAGKGARYTRGRRPVALVYQEQIGTHGDALRREMAVKRLSRHEKQRLIDSVIEPGC